MPHSKTIEERELRKLLWLHHGCKNLYGDDGELQCAKCGLDFKRDQIETIKHTLSFKNVWKDNT